MDQILFRNFQLLFRYMIIKAVKPRMNFVSVVKLAGVGMGGESFVTFLGKEFRKRLVSRRSHIQKSCNYNPADIFREDGEFRVGSVADADRGVVIV